VKDSSAVHSIAVTLLTGGSDKPYVLGLITELLARGVAIDLIGSDELDCAEFRNRSGLNFLNLRGDQRSDADFSSKMVRVLRYYWKLLAYAASAKPKIFHILWNNKFESFDRTLLMLYYKLLGKSVVLTAHNVNAGRRDSKDTVLNQLTLRIQYRLADKIFVHTEKMKSELVAAFAVAESRVSVIPFGINNTVPNTRLTPSEAKVRLGFRDGERTILFFGRITPYKGLEYLIRAEPLISARVPDVRIMIAGQGEEFSRYSRMMVHPERFIVHNEFISEERSAEYLNWRFLQHPQRRHHLVTARKDGRLCGFLLYHLAGEDATIVDLLAEEDKVVKAMLAETIAAVRRCGAQTISAPFLKSHAGQEILKDCGFLPRESTPVVVLPLPWAANPGNHPSADRWYLTHGDRES